MKTLYEELKELNKAVEDLKNAFRKEINKILKVFGFKL